MPWFRFIEEARHTLRFRNGTCELTFANLGGQDGWAWVAIKNGNHAAPVVLIRAGNVLGLQSALMRHGFEVPAGGPAEKIMRAAERLGKAEELPDDPHWRAELIKARGKAPRTHC